MNDKHYITSTRLYEREKELNCIYNVNNILRNFNNADFYEVIKKISGLLPKAFQYPQLCCVLINIEGQKFKSDNFSESSNFIMSKISFLNNDYGNITAYYTDSSEKYLFLEEEKSMIKLISDLIACFIYTNKINVINSSLKEDNITHSSWRINVLKSIVDKTDFKNLGIYGIYVIGSTKNQNAGPASDIDIIIHYTGNEDDKEKILLWFNAWSLSLNEWNYNRTGHYSEQGLLDIHLITDNDINNKTSYAVMLVSKENSAKPLKVLKSII
ncbi:MAG: hypothetical protein Kow0068_17780 [Marinilabiliales bacterium]